jgi:hypothetical protein
LDWGGIHKPRLDLEEVALSTLLVGVGDELDPGVPGF